MDVYAPVPRDCPAAACRPAESPDIASLTRRMVAGDEDAYRTFYDAYFDRLSRYLLVIAGGDEDAMREAVQATLVRVVRHIKVFAAEQQFWAWLTVVARTAFLDQTRSRRRYLAFLDRFRVHVRLEYDAAPGRADEQLQSGLERALDELAPDERQLVERKYLERRSVHELAAEYEVTEGAIESRLVRIRRKIKATVLGGLKDEP